MTAANINAYTQSSTWAHFREKLEAIGYDFSEPELVQAFVPLLAERWLEEISPDLVQSYLSDDGVYVLGKILEDVVSRPDMEPRWLVSDEFVLLLVCTAVKHESITVQ
ncbi:MAG: hypothetical protein JWO89_1055, partial [Verrucomicrobiaceae bacterium]|nr:hypothetical protein [Verrucomicrobiaceae bacterium]